MSRKRVVPAAPYYQQPASRRNYGPLRPCPINLVVIHTAESDLASGWSVVSWFGKPEARVSAHYVVSPDTIYQCVPDEYVAWAAPGANRNGIQVEFLGRASWTASAWQAHGWPASDMLVRGARLLAGLCKRYDIPVVLLDADALKGSGAQGITTHAAVSAAFKRSTHWDPGPGFPIADLLEMVRDLG